MKCPKCGYNSFEFLDSCKKCNSSLAAFKQSVGVRPVILPAGLSIASAGVAASVVAGQSGTGPIGPESSDDDIFQWDMSSAAPESSAGTSGIDEFDLNLDAAPLQATTQPSDPFSFDEDLLKTPSPQPEQPINVSTIDEFSFDLPVDNREAGIAAQEEVSAQKPGLSFDMESPATGFGEFSFDDASDTDSHDTTEQKMSSDPDHLQPATPFSFDAFGDFDAADLKGEAHPPTAVGAGLFELDSFLAMDDTPPSEKESGTPHAAPAAPFSGSDFDAIFGEVDETGSKD